METLERLRQRIATAGDLHSVVKTMKGLAAVSVRAFETAAEAGEHYRATVEMGLQVVLRQNPELAVSKRRPPVTGAVIYGSEQGLCGAFNRVVAEAAGAEFGGHEAAKLAAAGARGADVVGRQFAGQPVERLRMPASVDGITDCVADAVDLSTRWLEEEGVTRIVLVSNHLTVGSRFEPSVFTLFPFDPDWLEELRARPWASRCSPIHFTRAADLLKHLVRNHLFIGLYRAFAASLAAEHAARLAAMQVAERNIEERLGQLKQRFHQLRGAMVTEELLDVVSAFEALEGAEQSHAKHSTKACRMEREDLGS